MKWDTREYQRITSVEHRGHKLVVLFEDGSRASIDVSSIMPLDVREIDWDRLNHDGYQIIIPVANDQGVEIPWSTIRSLSDEKFNSYLIDRAEEEARQVGLRLKELRELRGISGKELAEKIDMRPQALSRIENGRHGISFPTLSRILAALGCSLKDLSPAGQRMPTLKTLLKHLDRLGITRDLALTRLVPKSILAANHSSPDVIEKAAKIISKIYSWSANSILEGRTLSFDTGALGHVRFKKYGRRNEIRATAYTLYAHWLVIQAVEATPQMKTKTIPSDAKKIRKLIEDRYGELSFSTLLNFVWDSGIVVLPLSDPGAFHGACWQIGDRIAIVVKQGTPYQAHWLFDLAHELAHAIKHLSTEHPTIIETEEITPYPETEDEVEASDFAEELILKGRAEALAQLCVERARNDLPRLKIAVQEIANEEDVPVDVLANYLAYRLSAQNENWWGTANNLQVETPSPLENARQELRARIQPFRLNPEDRAILLQALEDR